MISTNLKKKIAIIIYKYPLTRTVKQQLKQTKVTLTLIKNSRRQ